MSESKSNVPRLRFPGFTDPWERCKLGELLKYEQPQPYIVESTEYNDTYPIPVLTAGQSFLLGYTDELHGVKNANKNSPVIIFDDFTTSSHLVDFPFKIKSSAMKILTLDDESDDFSFAFCSLKNINYVPQSHERHWISKFATFDISTPKSSEQRQIGEFFASLDTLITLHQRKSEHLKLQKRGLLQKMFPRDGSDRPEIRFPGFTDPWEQRKLSEIVTVGSGRDYKHLGEGDIPVYGTGGYMLSVDSALSYAEDAIGIGRKGTIDKPHLLKAPFWTVDTLFYCIPKKDFDLQFALQLFNKIDWKQKDESTGVPSLSKETIHSVGTKAPKCEEQTQIGTFFQQLDTLITLHQRKLDNLKKQKKALLQQMFI